MAVEERSTFFSAIQALQSHDTAPDDRKRANDWLVQFQRSRLCWDVARNVMLDPAVSADIHLFAAQTLKSRARLMRSSPPDQCNQLQQDVLTTLHQLPNSSAQLTRQLCLALVDLSLPNTNTLGQLINHLTTKLQPMAALLSLEYMAEEVTSLTHFGSGGSNEERVEALAELKGLLRVHAGDVFGWLSQQVQNQSSPSPQHASNVLNCFNAWVRLGSLHAVSNHDDLQALVSIALSYLSQPGSDAFEASADALAEVVDYCPERWLGSLQEPMTSLVQVAVSAANAGQPSAAEHICRVVAPYAALRVTGEGVDSPSKSSMLNCLSKLSQITHISDSGDPACWPALQALIGIVENALGFDVDDVQEGYDHDEGGDEGQLRMASTLVSCQAAAVVSEEIRSLLDGLYISILQNMVAWQQPSEDSDGEVLMDGFNPSFMALLVDFLTATCDVVGSQRYTSLLCMMIEQYQSSSDISARVIAAAMHAVSAAGCRRLSSDPVTLQMLVTLMHKASSMAAQHPAHTQKKASASQASGLDLMPFCCAASSTGRSVLIYLFKQGKTAEALQFLTNCVDVALKALSLSGDQDSQDLQTPSSLAIKSLMKGAKEAGMAVPMSCIQNLVAAIQQYTKLGPLAEASLLEALSTSITSLDDRDGTRQRVQLQSLQQLTRPLSTLLEQLVSPQNQSGLPPGVDQQLCIHLRHLELLLKNCMNTQNEGDGNHDQQDGSFPPPPTAGTFSWLRDMFLKQLWPHFSKLLSKDPKVSGTFVSPLAKSLATLMRSAPDQCRETLPSIMEACVNCMFRPGGAVVYEPIAVALELFSCHGTQCLELLQMVVQHILADPSVSRLTSPGLADENPELAESCVKVCTSYARFTLVQVSNLSGETASSTVLTISRLAAACTCSHHRGVASAALTCSSELVAAASSEVRTWHSADHQSPYGYEAKLVKGLVHTILQAGEIFCMGVIGGLLSSFPLSRLHRACTILSELTALRETYSEGLRLHRPCPQNVSGWLLAAAAGCQLSQAEQQSIVQSWPPAMLEAAGGINLFTPTPSPELNTPSREQGLASRKLKKLLRDFADLHQRDA